MACAAALSARVLVKPPIWRDVRRYLPWSAVLVVIGFALVALAAWAVVQWPAARHVAGILALVGVVGAWLRSRPGYGKHRGWPPGSLGIAESFDAIGDRDYYRDRVRRYGPVFKTSQFGRPVVCVYGLALARDVLRDSESLVGATLPYNRFLPEGSLRYMGSRVHDETAPLFRSALSSVDLTCHEDVARSTCRRMLEGLAASSGENPGGVAPLDELRSWVFTVLSSVFWRLSPDDPRVRELRDIYSRLQLRRRGGPKWRRDLTASLEHVNDMMRVRATEPDLAAGGDDRSSVLGAALAADPAVLDNPARAHNLTLVFRLGTDDLTSLLDWVVAMLGDHPDWQKRVRRETPGYAERQPGDRQSVARRIVYETIRLEQSEYLYREVARPHRIAGYDVPKGWLLRVLVQESHRDPAIFAEPDRFDPDRFVGAERSRREYSPFGVDDHGCMGIPVLHFVARILVEEVCRGYELSVLEYAPPEKGTRHRDHWRPGVARRIRLTPAEGELQETTRGGG